MAIGKPEFVTGDMIKPGAHITTLGPDEPKIARIVYEEDGRGRREEDNTLSRRVQGNAEDSAACLSLGRRWKRAPWAVSFPSAVR